MKAVIEGVKIKKVLSSIEYAKLFFLLSVRIGNQINLKLDSLDKIEDNTFVKIKDKEQWYFIGNDNELDAIPFKKDHNKYSQFLNKKPGDTIVYENKYNPENREEIIDTVFTIEQYVMWKTVQSFQKLSEDGDLAGIQAIHIPKKNETIDATNLLGFLGDIHKSTEPIFDMYCEKNFPLAMLAVSEGDLIQAIGRICQEKKGFINFSTGTIEEFEKQKVIARKIIDEKIPFYIDGTSALFLSEIGHLKRIYEYIPLLKIPQSVINFLADTTEKFSHSYLGYVQGKISFSSIDIERRDSIQANFIESIRLFESIPENISVISSANKIDCFTEKKIPPELCDACILAQNENLPIMTEDYIYLQANEIETKKRAPEYFSSFALLRVLYESEKVSFEEYIDYFGYLSSYRFRFLSLTPDDIEKTVFGDTKIKTIKPENIKKLNFLLTLSEEYGVPFQTAFFVIVRFMFKMIRDDIVTDDIVEKIFIEILETFPTKLRKKDLGQMMLELCLEILKNNNSKFVLSIKTAVLHERVRKLKQITEIYL